MRIILFGKNGQLGWELQRALAPLGQLLALDRQGEGPFCGDLAHLSAIAQTIRAFKPDIIVNAAAFTAVDKAESEKNLAKLINCDSVAVLAQEALALNCLLVHYSTDYVFDGSGRHFWQESDNTSPLNYYGKSKLEGEKAIQAMGCRYLIFRTSWVYGRRGNNFAKIMLRLAQEREIIDVVGDQIGVPTGADLLADLSAHALRAVLNQPEKAGLYHVAPQGEISWYDYARFVIEYAKNSGAKLQVKTLNKIASGEYRTIAKRPLNSRLNTTKLSKTFAFHLPHWEVGVMRMLQEILGQVL